MTVGLVLVSHSATLAEGLRDLAAQMAADVTIIPAGGTDDGGIGTSYDRVEQSTRQILDAGGQALILTDLGSATMTVETLLDFLDDEPVVFADAPFVEATIAAAVAAQSGAHLDEVYDAAMATISTFTPAPSPADDPNEVTGHGDTRYSRTVTIADAAGLHARPAAQIAVLAADSDVTINGEDADSSLMIMGLGLSQGDTVAVAGSDKAVVDRIADAIEAGLD